MQVQNLKDWTNPNLDLLEAKLISDEWDEEYALPGLAHMIRYALRAQWEPDKVLAERRECDNILNELEDPARKGDELTFLKTLPSVPWEYCSAVDVVRVIRLALKAGAHGTVYKIALEGLKHHPNDADIQKYAHLYGPVQRTPSPSRIRGLNHMANKTWLAEHMGEYQNQWIAVRDGVLLGAAATLEELLEKVGDTKRALVTIGF